MAHEKCDLTIGSRQTSEPAKAGFASTEPHFDGPAPGPEMGDRRVADALETAKRRALGTTHKTVAAPTPCGNGRPGLEQHRRAPVAGGAEWTRGSARHKETKIMRASEQPLVSRRGVLALAGGSVIGAAAMSISPGVARADDPNVP